MNAKVVTQGLLVIADDDPSPVMTVDDVSVDENAGNAVIDVKLSAPYAEGLTCFYETRDGTATAPADYTTGLGEVFVPGGSTSVKIAIPIQNDALVEGSESFQFVILNGPNGPEPMVATVTILDDDSDPAPRVTIEQKTVSEGETGLREVAVKVTLSSAAPRPVRLEWKAYDEQTHDTVDTGVLELATGERTRMLTLRYVADALWGADRNIVIAIVKATNATASGEGSVTIVDDEDPPSMTLGAAVARESDAKALVDIVLSAPVRDVLRGSYRMSSGTALASSDFESIGGIFAIPAGSTVHTIEVPIVDDAVPEAAESFTVAVEMVLGATATAGATVTILDDDGAGRRRSMRR